MYSQQASQLGEIGLCIGLLFVTACVFTLFSRGLGHSPLWHRLDVVGVHHSSLFPWTRAILGSVFHTSKNSTEGYQRFSKSQNRPFLLPNIWTGHSVVVLPPSLLSALNRPDSELASHSAQFETIQLPYMISDRDVYENPIQFDVVRRMMSQKQVNSLAAATAEELDRAFRSYWRPSGESIEPKNEWFTVNNWNACGQVITRAAMRVLVGEPLCQNERLLELSTRYADAVIQGTAIINCLPPFTRPLIGPMFGLHAKYYQWRCLRILKPLIRERLKSKSGSVNEAPNDFVQWMILRSTKAGPSQTDASRIALRLLSLATMSVMGMVWVLSHCIQDLYRSPSKDEFLAGLEEECSRLVHHWQRSDASEDDSFRDIMARLHHLDSTLHESMRLSSISVVSLARDVVADDLDLGLGDGLKIPRGVRIVFPTQAMHTDPDFFCGGNPLEFDAFRYSRSDETDHDSKDTVSHTASSTDPSQSFLVWGHGRHACTGRWYAVQTLKQALAYIVSNYDIEVLGDSRPKQSLGNVILPDVNVLIKARRKINTE